MTIYLLAIVRSIINDFVFLMAIRTENVATNEWALISHQYIEEKNNGHYVFNKQHINQHKYGNSHTFNGH